MADFQTYISEVVPLSEEAGPRAAQHRWLDSLLRLNRWDFRDLGSFKRKLESFDLNVQALEDEGSLEEWPEFHHEINNERLWIFDGEDKVDLVHVCVLIQGFLKQFRPDGMHVIQWADVCSKARAGEFGGGAAVIRADSFVLKTTSDLALLIEEQMQAEAAAKKEAKDG